MEWKDLHMFTRLLTKNSGKALRQFGQWGERRNLVWICLRYGQDITLTR